MTATATFSDGTTKDVTSDASWSSLNLSVMTVSPTGVVTAVAFGVGSIRSDFQGRISSVVQVTATPAGTFGFEVAEFDAVRNNFNDTPLQKVIRLSAGESVTPLELAPHDMSYTVGADRCYPCRLIRIVSAVAGTLRLTLTWTGPRIV